MREKKITKESLKIKKTDIEFCEYKLEDVKNCDSDTWELKFDGSACLGCPKTNFVPEPGMTVRIYGKGFGYPVRGIEIDGHIMRYRTPKQAEEDHKKMCEKMDQDRIKSFKKNKKNMDKDYDNLPDLFKKRIDKFRNNNPNFRWAYENYEMFCCKEAVKIAKTLKTADEIIKWKDLPWEEQKKIVDISDGHSGNTMGCAINLACLYLSQYPEDVIKQYGAMAPLVGSKKYGCVPNNEEQIKRIDGIASMVPSGEKLQELKKELIGE